MFLENTFREDEKSRVELSIKDAHTGEIVYYHNPPLIHFADKELGTVHTGSYCYQLPDLKKHGSIIATLKIIAGRTELKINNLKIDFTSEQTKKF